MTLTVNDLIKLLKKVRNKDAVVVISTDGFAGEDIGAVEDETLKPADDDGNIGNVHIMLDKGGGIMAALREDDAYDVLGSLQNVANDDEADVIERLGVKAGYWWKCACNYVNASDVTACEGCGRRRNADVFHFTKYTLCKHCDHFVEENPAHVSGKDDYATFLHLEDGEQEFDHDAAPSDQVMTGAEWKKKRPDLFFDYPDGKIGPNSIHHNRRGKDDANG